MRGAVFLGNRHVEVRNFPDSTLGPGEVVIERKASDLCGPDLKLDRSPTREGAVVMGQRRTVIGATILGSKMGARVAAVETTKHECDVAREFGAQHALTSEEFEKQKRDLTRGEGVDLALDTAGISAARLGA